MTKFAITSVLVISMFLSAACGRAQSKATWISKEISDPAGVPLQAIESYINDQCQPSGLDGIQMFAVQNGATDAFKLHIYCRQDKAASTHYKVSLPTFAENGGMGKAVSAVVSNPKVRVGPFYFGKERSGDGFLLVEQTQ